jgi:hypothetical protein
VNWNFLKDFEIRSGGEAIPHLQYADDTLCIGEATLENLSPLNALLRGF